MIVIVLPDVADEQSLLRSATQDDKEALKEIYEQYFPPIYEFIRLRVSDREQAKDIAADVFLDFFTALKRKKAPNKSLRAWLFRVARNKIYDHYGDKQKLTTEALDEWIPADESRNPETMVFQSIRSERAHKALRMLVDEQQEVIILRFGQGLSIQETADLMDRSVSAIKSLQFRAIDRLRQILQNEGGA